MSGNRSRIARRETRGHDSTASHVHLEGQKHLSSKQQKKLDRIRAGECPRCGKEVPKEIAEGKVQSRSGRIVRSCQSCREIHQGHNAKYYAGLRARRGGEIEMATLMGERIKQAGEIDNARERFGSLKNAQILVVGVKASNVQPVLRDDPRVILWSTIDRPRGALPVVPTTVRVIICTRFCAHSYSQGLRDVANSRNLFMFSGLISPGVARQHLADILGLDKATTHVDTSDDAIDPLPRMPASAPTALPKLPPMRPAHTFGVLTPVIAEEPTPMAQMTKLVPQQPVDGNAWEAVLNDAVDMLENGIAALSLSKEAIVKAREQLRAAAAVNAADSQKLNALREMLRGI